MTTDSLKSDVVFQDTGKLSLLPETFMGILNHLDGDWFLVFLQKNLPPTIPLNPFSDMERVSQLEDYPCVFNVSGRQAGTVSA